MDVKILYGKKKRRIERIPVKKKRERKEKTKERRKKEERIQFFILYFI